MNDMIVDCSAFIINDGGIFSAVSNERLNRIKHCESYEYLALENEK